MPKPRHEGPPAPLPRPGGDAGAATPLHSARRRQVVDEAARLFDERGYHATSMEDIAATVGIRKPTLYHYFSSKEEILHSIHEEFIELLLARQEQRARTTMPAAQMLLEMMADILELMETHRGHVRVFFEHHRELAAPAHAEIAAKRRRYEAMASELIERGVREGALRADVNVRLVTLAMFGMCNWAYQWYRPSGALRTREVAYVFWDALVHGIEAPPAPSPC